MKRWTNGLPGATKRLGANLALRGLSVSQCGCARIPMMARSKIAPLQRPNTLMQLSRSSVLKLRLATRGRAIHVGTTRHFAALRNLVAIGAKRTSIKPHQSSSIYEYAPWLRPISGYYPRMFPPERIVCLTEETVETLYLLGEDARIVGVSGYAVRPPRVRREKRRGSAVISPGARQDPALAPDPGPSLPRPQAAILAE